MWDGRSVPNYMSFSAGGTYGLMYIGMYRALRDHIEKISGISGNDFFEKLKGVSGVSAGALAALCLLLDKMDDLHDIFADKMLNKLIVNPDFALLLQDFGLSRGDVLRDLISRLLRKAGISEEVTFEGLKRLVRRDFVCVATVLRTSQPMYFSCKTTPNAKVVDAVYSSMCVPFLFVPHSHDGTLLVDGVLSLPVADAFPPDETVFVDFDYKDFALPLDTFQQYCIACLTARAENFWYRRYRCLTLRTYDDTHPCDFSIGNKVIEMRIKCGYATTLTCLYLKLLPCLGECIMFVLSLINGSSQQESEFDDVS